MTGPRSSLLARLGPGILIAATGVGAGDLATGAFTGSKLGLAILWVVVLGAFVKFVLNEGLARWQLATGTTLLEGTVQNSWPLVQWLFLGYLLIWTLGVGAALMSACGVAATAIINGLIPNAIDPVLGKQVFGVLHSVVAVTLVRLGGFRLFEKTMGVCIAVMFVTVIATAIISAPPWRTISQASGIANGPRCFNRRDRSMPSTYSITRKCVPSTFPASVARTMCGSSSLPTAFISRSNRATAFASCMRSAGRILRATSLSSLVCSAL